jgi:hypothetical protein
VSNMRKELAIRELAKALEKMDLAEIEALAKRYDVDIEDALGGEFFTKANLGDEADSLTDLARRTGSKTMISVAKKLDALAKRMDEQDAERADALEKIERLELLARTSSVRQ